MRRASSVVSSEGMRVSQARQIAFEILQRVETADAFAADLLHARLSEASAPRKREDAALATELTLGVLRWQRLLDFLLERYAGRRVTDFDLEVLLALRLGLYQLRFLSRVPARAAVHESVELVKWARKGSAARLVNAVLRRASSEKESAVNAPLEQIEQQLPPDLPLAERLGILYSHPTWMVERWLQFFGAARTKALLEADNRPAHVTCTLLDSAHAERAISSLREAGLSIEPGRLLRSAWATRGGDPADTEAFRRGWISIQDEASQLVALLLDADSSRSVLDLCAAPGGKTAVLAHAAGPQSLVVAADRHLHRLRAMKTNLNRLGVTNVHLLALDATAPLPLAANFDRILVDAPCSGTGTLSRNPEIRWRLGPNDLADFHRRQVALLSSALDRLAPGGRLVYSTCSLEPEENEQVVAEVLQGRRDIRRACGVGVAALKPHLAPGVNPNELFDAEENFRTSPPEHQTDGFFAAILERAQS